MGREGAGLTVIAGATRQRDSAAAAELLAPYLPGEPERVGPGSRWLSTREAAEYAGDDSERAA